MALLFVFSLTGKANEVFAPTDVKQLQLGTVVDRAFRVKTAKVVIFNRESLERDFSNLRGLDDKTIENWILDNFAYINANQLRLTGIRNTPIEIDRQNQKDFYIPPGVGRGAVVKVEGFSRLVDLKATGNSSWNRERVNKIVELARASEEGMKKAREKDHSNGLETYSLATAEYLRQFEIQQDYNQRNASQGSQFETVESYFLIDYGFNIIYNDGVEIPAFEYGRQSHFGRTANNHPLKDEIYKDKGEFQGTYTESRIDFGGARTTSELNLAYHDAAKLIRPDQVADFIRREQKRILENHRNLKSQAVPLVIAQTLLTPLVPVESASKTLSRRHWDYEIKPRPAAIGLAPLDVMEKKWSIDVPEIARIKWTLFQLDQSKLKIYLDSLGDDALRNLFHLSVHKFQMPLPEFVYTYGFDRAKIQSSAITAASKVFDRYPKLVAPSLKLALAALHKVGDSWSPSEIDHLINVEVEFANYKNFLLNVVKSKNPFATGAVIERLFYMTDKSEKFEEVLSWIQNNETDENVLRDFIYRFRHRFPAVQCKTKLFKLLE